MATNKRFGRKIPEWARREDTPGTRVDSGPFIGYVKNNFDPLRAGRLQVWIPDLGGDEKSPASWRTVGYASPYGGSTYKPADMAGSNNEFSQVPHSYGMWGVPPDINCQVIVTFIAGDPNRGYWFACVNTDLSHYMVPGLASGELDMDNVTDEALKLAKVDDSNWPVVEYNEIMADANNGPGFASNAKPPHNDQVAILLGQGLDRDTARGAVSSSSQRESPSQVFGISTPGRPTNDPADMPDFQTKMKEGTLTPDEVTVKSRKGGHTFVMDDGAQDGTSQLIRLRTAGGHQLLLNDSDDIIYIGNNAGTTWLEFTSGGHINMYGQQGINMRTEGEFNIHADKDINIHSKTNINVKADAAIAQQTAAYSVKATTIGMQASSIGILSTGEMKIQGASGSFKTAGDLTFKGGKIYLNTSTPADVTQVPDLKTYQHSDTSAEASGLWISKEDVFESITTVAPAHEPWPRNAAATGKSLNEQTAPVTKQSSTGLLDAKVTGSGPLGAKGQPVNPQAPVSEMTAKGAPSPGGLYGLNSTQVKALMVQIGYAESKSDYTKLDSILGRIGKYQINGALLETYGYLSSPDNMNAWIGQDGVKTGADWLSHTGVQDTVMENIINDFHEELVNQQAILATDDARVIAGMISVAYFFRDAEDPIQYAVEWRQTGEGLDINGLPGSVAYNWGRYAIDVLAAPSTTLVAGPSSSGVGPESVINFTNGSGDLAHYNMLGSAIKTSMEKMAAEYKAKTGRKITLSSAVRTMEEQTKIYNGWLAAGGSSSNRTVNVPGYGRISMPAKPSSNSPHVRGIAFDIGRSDIQELLRLGLLDKYAFNFPFPVNDPVHIQYRG